MVNLIISLAITSTITSITALRFRKEKDLKFLTGYFLFVFVLEWLGKKLFLPEGALGLEIAYVCFALTGLFITVISVILLIERKSQSMP